MGVESKKGGKKFFIEVNFILSNPFLSEIEGVRDKTYIDCSYSKPNK